MKVSLVEPVVSGIVDGLLEYDDFTRTLLSNRGIKDPAEAEKFLNPNYERDIFDPFLIKNMGKAVDRIIRAIEGGEKIVIYGDYDCDGIPGSVVVHDFFKKIGYRNFSNYIPHRHLEGYGLNTTAIDNFAKDGVTLLITVDLAIANVEEVRHAESLGINVVVTDHHLPGVTLPPAYAIINSKQEGDKYPDNMLAGAGVAWKLVQALVKKNGKKWGITEGWEKWLLDMAGLSTIADMVPLKNENRAIAHFGLKVLRKSTRPGLQALLQKMRVDQRTITEDDISFMVAPRINAASRMDVPLRAFEMLSTKDEVLGRELAERLHSLNDERKIMVALMSAEVKRKMDNRELKDVLVIGNPDWRPGLLGILANNLAETYERPTFVWGKEGGENLKGSCRSDGTVNVVELMLGVSEGFFINAGGHEFSGGFSVSYEKIHFLEEELLKAHKKIKKVDIVRDSGFIDATLSVDDVTEGRYKIIEKFAPFGIGNPKPIFLFKNETIKEIKKFGKEKNHLELIFENSHGKKISAISFFFDFKKDGDKLLVGESINLTASFEKSNFGRQNGIRLRIVELC